MERCGYGMGAPRVARAAGVGPLSGSGSKRILSLARRGGVKWTAAPLVSADEPVLA